MWGSTSSLTQMFVVLRVPKRTHLRSCTRCKLLCEGRV